MDFEKSDERESTLTFCDFRCPMRAPCGPVSDCRDGGKFVFYFFSNRKSWNWKKFRNLSNFSETETKTYRAARWRFQLAVTGCTFELRGRTLKRPPHRLCLLLTRKKRKVSSAQFKWHCTQPTRPSAVALVVGNEQEPLDFQSTLNTKTTVDDVSIFFTFLCSFFFFFFSIFFQKL